MELVVNRRTYRVGQSFFAGPDERAILTIAVIQPLPRKALCHKFVRLDACFACPPGREGSYARVPDHVALDLACLTAPCQRSFDKFPLTYRQDDERQRAFAYSNDAGKVLHHPAGRPAVCEPSPRGRRPCASFAVPALTYRRCVCLPSQWICTLELEACPSGWKRCVPWLGTGGNLLPWGRSRKDSHTPLLPHLSRDRTQHFDVKWVVDSNHLAAATLRANKSSADVQIYTEDVKTFLKRSVQGHPCYPKAGEVDHIHGSRE